MENEFHLQKHAKGQRPYFFDDPAIDKLLAMLMASCGEVAVLRDRLDTIERIMETKGLFERDEIESFRPTKSVLEERDARREDSLAQILRIVDVDVDNGKMGRNDDSVDWKSVIDSVTSPE
jgi:hypothetical protein